jgi:hypothetical protein
MESFEIRVKNLFNEYDKCSSLSHRGRIKLFKSILTELKNEPYLKSVYDDVKNDMMAYYRELHLTNDYRAIEYFEREFRETELKKIIFPAYVYQDRQNVHCFTSSMIKAIKCLTSDYPVKYERPFEHVFLDYIEKAEEPLTENIKAVDVFASVYAFIFSHKDKDEMLKRLHEEMNDSSHMCLVGHVTRLVNSIRGFESSIEIDMDEYERERAIFFYKLNKMVNIDHFLTSIQHIVNDVNSSIYHELRENKNDMKLLQDYSKHKWEKNNNIYSFSANNATLN